MATKKVAVKKEDKAVKKPVESVSKDGCEACNDTGLATDKQFRCSECDGSPFGV